MTEGLRVENLTVRYGGNMAVDGFSFEVPLNTIVGLIGPNGAGKTTTFDACSGLKRATCGKISLLGQEVTRRPAQARARMGLGRTFQRMELCDSLTISQNVRLGVEARSTGRSVIRAAVTSPSLRKRIEVASDAAMDMCGLFPSRHSLVGHLSTGERRLVELARAIACDFEIIMFDEPSSGLDTSETTRLAEILKEVRAVRGTGMLLVEHDISLVRNCCEYVYVLDFGCLIAQGPVAQVLSSRVVVDAYLGTEAGASA
jgi:ABC-type branched-subunit amino acid transport system ATPase component